MENINKKDLIEEIKKLIDKDSNNIEINIKYIDYFELEELIEIRDSLIYKIENRKEETSTYLDDIFTKCSS
ncbi:MAG: hypothetical protein KAJ49_03790 [Arcobacteraceae bacterium]|nr:hypothetical protein [Arcobacteraceae bacterium]